MLTEGFNSMMSQIREMTGEREKQNEILQEKVAEATGELQKNNEQLETANLELFQTTRKMAEMERLAAAGQTAAEFAHEVGTPAQFDQRTRSAFADDVCRRFQRNESPANDQHANRTHRNIVREMLDRTRFGASEHAPLNLNELLRTIFDAVEPTLAKK